ncbi:MAG TPA: AlkA N-terminal domain-containing protein [Solirubrobacteraceae bacterium]|nr:AlkA N-terminal domain-containing protein [Solirubrobacteraceae bacterium]
MTAARIAISLPYTAPLDAAALLDYFARRAVPGIERVADGVYERSLALPHGPGVVALDLGAAAAGDGPLHAELTLSDARDRAAVEALLRALLDLDHDPGQARELLGGDPLLAGALAAAPGRRVPGAADATELCVRTVLGQQISLAAAATAAGRLVARYGAGLGPLARGAVTHLFPTAAALAAADPETLAMPRARARCLVGLAAALASGELPLRRGGDGDAARARLLALPGIGPWSADYIVMRVLGDHDVFLAGDLGVRRALERAGLPADPRSAAALAERWRPLRSYAMQYLWAL